MVEEGVYQFEKAVSIPILHCEDNWSMTCRLENTEPIRECREVGERFWNIADGHGLSGYGMLCAHPTPHILASLRPLSRKISSALSRACVREMNPIDQPATSSEVSAHTIFSTTM